MNLFSWRKISLVILYGSISLLLFSLPFTMSSPLGQSIFLGILILGILAFTVITAVKWKCPYCGRRFEIKRGEDDHMEYCPYCNEKLR